MKRDFDKFLYKVETESIKMVDHSFLQKNCEQKMKNFRKSTTIIEKEKKKRVMKIEKKENETGERPLVWNLVESRVK